MDETYIKVNGQWKYYYRAVDKQGRLKTPVGEEKSPAAMFSALTAWERQYLNPFSSRWSIYDRTRNTTYNVALRCCWERCRFFVERHLTTAGGAASNSH